MINKHRQICSKFCSRYVHKEHDILWACNAPMCVFHACTVTEYMWRQYKEKAVPECLFVSEHLELNKKGEIWDNFGIFEESK